MFLLYFLDTYIHMLKNLQRVPLDKCIINLHSLHQDAGKTWMTWIGHNATRYHNFITLPHSLSHVLPFIFSQFNMDRS